MKLLCLITSFVFLVLIFQKFWQVQKIINLCITNLGTPVIKKHQTMHSDSGTFQSLDSHISVSDYASSIHPLVVDCRRPKRPSVVYRRRPKTYSSVVYRRRPKTYPSVVYRRRRNSTYENTKKKSFQIQRRKS
jgi:hypothetical protein